MDIKNIIIVILAIGIPLVAVSNYKAGRESAFKESRLMLEKHDVRMKAIREGKPDPAANNQKYYYETKETK